MPDRSSLSPSEVTELLTDARDSFIVNNGGDAILLDEFDTPGFNFYAKGMDTSNPTRGEYKALVTGRRGGSLQVYSGRDLLKFYHYDTTFELTYGTGSDHLGDELAVQQAEEAGVSIDFKNSTSEGKTYTKLSPDAKAAAINLAKTQMAQFQRDYHYQNNFLFWQANASLPKAYAGIDAQAPTTTNSTGQVGGRDRSNPLLRHQLITGVTIDTIELSMTKMMVQLEDAGTGGGSQKYLIVCGNDVFFMLSDLWLGTSTRAGKIDRMLAMERAAAWGQKYGIGLPDSSFIVPELGVITRDASFARLDVLEPTATNPWRKRMYFLPQKTMKLRGPRHAEFIAHPMPHNQEIIRYSLKGKKALVNEAPNRVGVMVLA